MKKITKVINQDLLSKDLIDTKDILNSLQISQSTWALLQSKGKVSLKTLKKISIITERPLMDYLDFLDEKDER